MRAEFSATRAEARAGGRARRETLREEIRAGDEETRPVHANPARGSHRTHRSAGRHDPDLACFARCRAARDCRRECGLRNAQQAHARYTAASTRVRIPPRRASVVHRHGRQGEPVVLMHAITGTSESWAPQIDGIFESRLSRDRVRSARLGPKRGRSRNRAAARTRRQMIFTPLPTHLRLARFHLVGVAGGGFVALDYAAAHPERLSSLVVGASTGSVSDKEIQDVIARIEIPGIRSLPGPFPRSRRVVSRHQPRGHETLARDRRARASARRADAAPALAEHFAKLATITTRTLVVAADADLIAPPGLMKIWARHVKGAQWTTVPDAGHSIAWEQPAIFNDVVLRFLEGRPSVRRRPAAVASPTSESAASTSRSPRTRTRSTHRRASAAGEPSPPSTASCTPSGRPR